MVAGAAAAQDHLGLKSRWKHRRVGGKCWTWEGWWERPAAQGPPRLEPHQAERLRQLQQGVLGPLPGVPQLAQRVLVGLLAQPLRERAQAHEVALLLPLLLHRGDVEALQGRGEAGCGGKAGEAWSEGRAHGPRACKCRRSLCLGSATCKG